MIQGELGGPLTLDVPHEHLHPGPVGSRLAVIDYDFANQRFYEPVNLDDTAIAMQAGLAPCEVDPRFHQQMVYAVASKVLETFDAALGRKIRFLRDDRRVKLRIFPHAFEGANAFYDPNDVAVLFGYYRASRRHPGRHQPGQIVFTCLSHDIIAHEVTHAVLDRIKRHYRFPTSHDAGAFHEGFSDAVTILHQFSFPALLRETIAKQHGNLGSHGVLADLAEQFGQTSGAGAALRSVIDAPDAKRQHRRLPVHDRGAILAAAIFSAFLRSYEARTRDLLRLATGGLGRLPEGELPPDLVNRLAAEAAAAARSILQMCIRALEYAPPVDLTFGDYLRAIVTSDREIDPTDRYGQRRAMIEEFLRRGLYVEGVRSPAEDALCWDETDGKIEPLAPNMIGNLFLKEATARSKHGDGGNLPTGEEYACKLLDYARNNQELLGLVDTDKYPPDVAGFHALFRSDTYGQPVIELVAQLVQQKEDPDTGIPLLGGTTLVARLGEGVRYVIRRKLPVEGTAGAKDKLEERRAFLDTLSAGDPLCAWTGALARWDRLRRLSPFTGPNLSTRE